MRRVLLAVLSALLLTLAQPFSPRGGAPWLWGWNGLLAWVALIPFWMAARDRPAREAFRLGFLMGFLHAATGLYWLLIALHLYGGLSLPLSLLVLAALSAWLALFPAAAAFAALSLRPRLAPALCLPLAWGVAEWLRGHLLTGFPWLSLAGSQWRLLWPLQAVDLLGPDGLSALIVLVNVALAEAWARAPGSRRPLLAAGGLLAAVLSYGALRVWSLDRDRALRPRTEVALVQGDVSQDVKHDRAFDTQVRGRYNAALSLADAPLVVWPEAALPQAVHLRSETLLPPDLAVPTRSWLLTGAASWWEDGGTLLAHNSALLVDPSGRIVARYHKAHLVPFGEYVPLPGLLFFVRKLTHGVADFLPGSSLEPLETPAGKVGVLICYEDVFPAIARGEVKAGAEVLVNLTNDAWYGRSSAPWQHLAMSVLRAVETRRPVLRATQSGVTAEIDDAGRVLGSIGVFAGPGTLQAHPARGGPGSLFLFLGDLFGPACLGALLLLALGRRLRYSSSSSASSRVGFQVS